MATRPFNGFATHVLDASAVLAILLSEPGGERVIGAGRDGVLSSVNFTEAITKMNDRGASFSKTVAAIDELGFLIASFDTGRAKQAGALREQTRRRNISLADRACLALALETGLPVMTTDRAWPTLDLGIDIRLIR